MKIRFVSEHDGQVSGLIIAYHGKDAESLDEPIVKRLRMKMKDPSVTLDKEAEMKDFYLDTLCPLTRIFKEKELVVH